jgi:hypothetical protein
MNDMKMPVKDPLFKRWKNMMNRCYDSRNKAYKWYGGAGVVVCNEWKNSFAQFIKDTGFPPFKGAQIDRIDGSGNYEPNNVQWVTSSRNNRNRKSSRFITFDGQTLCIADWADKLGLNRKSIMSRLNMGWPIEEVLNAEKKHRWSRRKKNI